MLGKGFKGFSKYLLNTNNMKEGIVMKYGIPNEIFGAWVATKEDIIRMNKKAKENHRASFEEQKLLEIIDDKAHQLVAPMLIHDHDGGKPKIFRCYVWIKLAQKNGRVCALMDFDIEDIKLLQRPSEEGLHGIIFMFLECQSVVNLNRINENNLKL